MVLNLSQNHLDWHPTMADYRESKRGSIERTACQVVNLDDAASDPLVPVAAATGAAAGVPTGAGAGATAGAAARPRCWCRRDHGVRSPARPRARQRRP